MASERIRARFENGVLKPLEAVQLDESEEVMLSIEAGARVSDTVERFVPDPHWGEQADGQDLIELLYEARLAGSRIRPNL